MADDRETCEVNVPAIDPTDEIFTATFQEFDTDHSGHLDKKEFHKFIAKAGQGKLSAYIFKIIDADGNGKVSLDEFLLFGRAMNAVMQHRDPGPYMRMIFDACDKGRKGKLTKSEFLKFMKYTGNKVGLFQRGKQFKAWDADKNGFVEFEEIMTKIKFCLGLG